MATVEVPILPVDQIEAWQPDDRDEFMGLVLQRQQLKDMEDAYKEQREQLDKRIEAMLLVAGAADGQLKVQVDGHTQDGLLRVVVQRVTSRSASKLDPKLLLQSGVSSSVIAKCTVEGKPYSYVLVKEVSERR